MSAGIDYLRHIPEPEKWRPTYRTTPEKCADHGHPGCTYNPWQDRTWCLCGDVIRDGNQVTVPHAACCGGVLTEVIEPPDHCPACPFRGCDGCRYQGTPRPGKEG